MIAAAETARPATRPLGTVARLTKAAAAAYWSGAHEVNSRSQYRPHIHARWAVWIVLRERGWSTPRIGNAFGRDGSTVRTGLLSAAKLAGQSPRFAAAVAQLREVA